METSKYVTLTALSDYFLNALDRRRFDVREYDHTSRIRLEWRMHVEAYFYRDERMAKSMTTTNLIALKARRTEFRLQLKKL